MLSISPFPNPSLWNYLIDFNQILCIIFLSSVFFLKPKHDGFVQEMIQCKRKIYRKLGGSLSYSLKPNCQYYKSLCVGFLIYKYRIFKLDQYSSMMRPHEGCKVRHSNIFFLIQKVQNCSMIYIGYVDPKQFVRNKRVYLTQNLHVSCLVVSIFVCRWR